MYCKSSKHLIYIMSDWSSFLTQTWPLIVYILCLNFCFLLSNLTALNSRQFSGVRLSFIYMLQPSKKFASIVLIGYLILWQYFDFLAVTIEFFRFFFSKYNFLLSLISCCIFSFCSLYFSDSRL